MDEVIVEGEVTRVAFESDSSGFRVVKVRSADRKEAWSIVGVFPPVRVGARVRVSGVVETSPKHGSQIRAASVIELGPATLKGLARYLGSGGIKGIGEKSAERIVSHFGVDAFQVLDRSPERLVEVRGLGKSRALQIAAGWREQRAERDIMMFLQTHDISPSLARRIHKQYGPAAMSVVAQQPYRLAMDVTGIGFLTADKIAQSLGTLRDAPERIQAGLLHVLTVEAGHCYASERPLLDAAGSLLGIADVDLLRHGLTALSLGGYVVAEDVESERVYFTRAIHRAEVRLAARLLELAAGRVAPIQGAAKLLAGFEREQGIVLADEQRTAALAVSEASVLVVTGGPGVGKTTVLRAILAVLASAKLSVRLAAPTGRAAKRMAELTGREAQTLHRMLEVDPKAGGFKRTQAHPVDAGVIVVDEASMVDLMLADALTQATSLGSRLVLVGDVDQLPSIGPGAVLRDILDSGVARAVRLEHIFRQAKESLIVVNAHRINSGEMPAAPNASAASPDFFVVRSSEPEAARRSVLELVTKSIPRRFGLDPVNDVQVLVPMNRGEVGSLALNAALQAALNPAGPELVRHDRTLRVHDKVMQLRNDYEKDVWNGDVGFIEHVDTEGRTLTVRFDDRAVRYEANETDDLALAYACTIHKSQGSEFAAVIVVMLSSHFVMLSKSLLYTAITRGKRLVVLLTDRNALKVALSRDRRGDRRTRLAWRLAPRPSAG